MVSFAVGPDGFALSHWLESRQARRSSQAPRSAGLIIGDVTVAMAITFPLVFQLPGIWFTVPS